MQARIEIGFVDTAARFEALLQAAFPSLTPWARMILDVPTPPAPVDPPARAIVRQLDSGDAADVARLDPKLAWIASTWGGPASLAASGYAC